MKINSNFFFGIITGAIVSALCIFAIKSYFMPTNSNEPLNERFHKIQIANAIQHASMVKAALQNGDVARASRLLDSYVAINVRLAKNYKIKNPDDPADAALVDALNFANESAK